MDNNYLKAFLLEARENLLKLNKPKWLVIGNESSDLDSAICSIVYSYYKQSIIKEKYYLIPIISIPKKYIESKKDVIYWLNVFNIDYSTDLIYLDEILLLLSDNISFDHNLIITLVDHHKPIKSTFIQFIKEVIDHREISFEYSENHLDIKNIQLVGSCSTLIAAYVLKSDLLIGRNHLLKMLYGVILLDTDCLDLTNSRTTQADIDICNQIETILTMTEENKLEIYSALRNAKSDTSELTFIQKIRRDLKFIDVSWKNSNIKIALPTVVESDVEDFLSMDDIKSQLHQAITELEANMLIILTCGRDTIKRRGYMIFAEDSDLRNKISQFLLKETHLKLSQIQIEIPCNVVVFIEHGLLTTRKLFIPLLEKCFSQESDDQYHFQSNNCNIQLWFDEIDSNYEVIEHEGGPYTLSTPKRSCSGSPDSRNSEMNLPSLNNRRTLALIDQKRQKHIAEIEVIEDENEDINKNFGDDESPLAYTPENSDEENDSDKDNNLPTQIFNPESVEEEHKLSLTSIENKENSLKIIETDILSTVKKSVYNTKGNQFSKLQKSDQWNEDLDSLYNEVDKKRQKLETSHFDSDVNTIVTDSISMSKNTITTEKLYQKILSNWSDSYSEEEKGQFLRTIEMDDKLNMAKLLTTGIIRDCISEFDMLSVISNAERNNSAISRDIDDNKLGVIDDLNENEEETSEGSLQDSTIPDLEINYNSCPVDTIINIDCQGISNIGSQSGFDVENSSFNLYRRISKNQLDFTEDEKKLFAIAGNWYPDEDVIYSDSEHEPYQIQDNESKIDVPKKIIYPSKDITMNVTNLDTNTSTEMSLNDLDIIPSPDFKVIIDNNLLDKNENFQFDSLGFNSESKGLLEPADIIPLQVIDGIFTEYNKVIRDAGHYFDWTNNNNITKIITISNCYLPERSNENYQRIMEYVFNYMITVLENIDTEFYTIVFFYCYGNRAKAPSLNWLHQFYKTINYRLRKNVKHLYIVHPTIFLKAAVFLYHIFIKSKFYVKIEFIKKLSKLHDYIPTENIEFADDVLKCN